MAIEKTGVEVDVSSSFESPTTFEENGIVDHIDIDGLNQLTEYYVRGYIIENGSTTYSDNTLSFNTIYSLPPELQECEFIESDGNCFIDTGIYLDTYSNLETKIYVPQGASFGLFGGRTDVRTKNFCGIRNSNQYISMQITNSNTQYQALVETIDDMTVIFKNNGKDFEIDDEQGNTLASNQSAQNATCVQTCYLFDMNNNGVGYGMAVDTTKIYYFKKEGVFWLVPCYVKPGETFVDVKGNPCIPGTAGFIDVLSNQFFTNDGPGDFRVGPDL